MPRRRDRAWEGGERGVVLLSFGDCGILQFPLESGVALLGKADSDRVRLPSLGFNS